MVFAFGNHLPRMKGRWFRRTGGGFRAVVIRPHALRRRIPKRGKTVPERGKSVPTAGKTVLTDRNAVSRRRRTLPTPGNVVPAAGDTASERKERRSRRGAAGAGRESQRSPEKSHTARFCSAAMSGLGKAGGGRRRRARSSSTFQRCEDHRANRQAGRCEGRNRGAWGAKRGG